MRCLIPICCLLALTQCSQEEDVSEKPDSGTTTLEKFTYHQPMMGTRFSIVLYASDQSSADTAAKAAFEYAAKVNDTCSDYDVTSELMQLNAAPANQAVKLSPMLFEVLDEALQIARQTKGAYDPTLGWHSYNWRMARKKGRLPTTEQINKAKAASGWQNLLLDHNNHSATKRIDNMRLDLGGIAKGFAADAMLAILNQHNITRASVIAGGEVLLGDPPPDKIGWQVTLMTLDSTSTMTPEKVTRANCAISTSGDIYQSITIDGQRYSHIVDPSTGLGLTRRISATIIGSTCTLTDALATAHCVNPQLTYPDVKTIIVSENKNGEIIKIRDAK